MRVTLKDIARRSGVSVNTVSLALRDMPGVRQQTKDNILRIAEEIGYFGQKGKLEMRNIGLVSTGERLRDSYFYMSFHQHILNTVHEYNYNLMVFKGATCDIAQEELRWKFESNSIAGIIILGDMEERIAAKVAQCGIPIIATGTRYDALDMCVVIEDNLKGGHMAVEYLWNKGYRKLGFVGNPKHSTGFMERFQGYVGSMMSFGLPVDPEYLVIGMDQVQVYDYNCILASLKRCKSLPEAFICTNDNMAMLTARALLSMGYSVPGDIALIGFDNTVMGKMAIPSITSVDVHCAVQAEVCVKKLISMIQGGESCNERILLPVSIAEGESVRSLID